jgi:hypothetical protein
MPDGMAPRRVQRGTVRRTPAPVISLISDMFRADYVRAILRFNSRTPQHSLFDSGAR